MLNYSPDDSNALLSVYTADCVKDEFLKPCFRCKNDGCTKRVAWVRHNFCVEREGKLEVEMEKSALQLKRAHERLMANTALINEENELRGAFFCKPCARTVMSLDFIPNFFKLIPGAYRGICDLLGMEQEWKKTKKRKRREATRKPPIKIKNRVAETMQKEKPDDKWLPYMRVYVQ